MWNKQLWYNFLENNSLFSTTKPNGEIILEKTLKELKYDFCPQYSFKDLRGDLGGRLRFDFALLDKSSIPFKPLMLIEFQGQQHYDGSTFFDNMERLLKNDKLKKEYCLKNNLPLLEVYIWDIQKQNFSGWLDSEIKRCLGQTEWFGETY